MTDGAAILIALLTSIPPTITALVAVKKIKRVHRELNSRLTQWKEETKTATVAAVIAAYSKGKSDEKEKHEKKDEQP